MCGWGRMRAEQVRATMATGRADSRSPANPVAMCPQNGWRQKTAFSMLVFNVQLSCEQRRAGAGHVKTNNNKRQRASMDAGAKSGRSAPPNNWFGLRRQNIGLLDRANRIAPEDCRPAFKRANIKLIQRNSPQRRDWRASSSACLATCAARQARSGCGLSARRNNKRPAYLLDCAPAADAAPNLNRCQSIYQIDATRRLIRRLFVLGPAAPGQF